MEHGATNLDGVRTRNLAAILERAHRAGPLTRAAITQATGLHRSTVAALVAELESRGLIIEGDPLATSRVGRPSPLVSASTRAVAIAVNPEVDAITVGIVGLGARVDAVVRRAVDHIVDPQEAVELVAEIVASLAGPLTGHRVVGVGVAVPGLVRASDDLVRWAPHLGWREVAFAALLEERLELPTTAGNDASLGVLAEHLFGAGRGLDDLVYLNGGASGIGGGVVVGGRPLSGSGGYAGEFGQNRPGVADPADRRTRDGTLEDEVSRARLIEVLGISPSVDESQLEQALLLSTQPAVAAEVAREQRLLAVALSNAINVLNPTRVILGGFLASLLAVDPDELSRLVAESALAAAAETVEIVPAALGSRRLLIGAAELAFAGLLADPTR